MPGTSYGMERRLGAARAGDFSLVSTYKYGYRNREDITNLPAGVLIKGSQNVLTNVSERVQIRQGYSVDGQTSSVNAPILGCIDWLTRNNSEVNVRSGFLTTTSSAKVQFRHDASGTVTWNDLITGLSSSSFNFTKFWRTDESLRVMLGVNGDGNIYEWNGAVATINSSASATITTSGTWFNSGFYSSQSGRSIVIGSSVFTYTGGENTDTLTGVSPNASGITIGALAHQQYITTACSTFIGIGSSPMIKVISTPNLISVLNNQVYLGSTTNPAMWMSKVNSYTDYSNSSPRQPGEGGTLILDENMTAFVVQGTGTPTASATMYLSAGKDLWYQTTFTSGTDLSGVPYETIGACPIKVGPLQGAISQAAVGNMKNYVLMATNETTIDMMGVLPNYLTEIQTQNISDPIKLDIDSYDFTDASVFYYRYYVYVAVPKEGVVLAYNLTSQTWDAPHTIPISRFFISNGELYGHSYNTSESYKLFTGYADRVYPGFAGYPIPANMAFSYDSYGTRHALKKATAAYFEGYVSANTVITFGLTYELDGCATQKIFTLSGDNAKFVCIGSDAGSLGKNSLGKIKLGGSGQTSIQGLPPKFRYEPTFSNTNFFEVSVSISINGVNQNFQLIAFGLNASIASEEAVYIRD